MEYEFKGTKGEWRREDTEHYAEIATDGNPRLAMVANMHDANLIAAAPDLLGACIELHKSLEKFMMPPEYLTNAIHKALNIQP